jgi:hypothetical protein
VHKLTSPRSVGPTAPRCRSTPSAPPRSSPAPQSQRSRSHHGREGGDVGADPRQRRRPCRAPVVVAEGGRAPWQCTRATGGGAPGDV